MTERTQIAIVGAGLSGLLAALALEDGEYGAGRDVTLIDAGEIGGERPDARATALTPSALRLLSRLGLGDLPATAMAGMRVGEGGSDTPWQFELPERQDEPLGYIVENAALRAALLGRLRDSAVTLRERSPLQSLRLDGPPVLRLDDGSEIGADLVVAADGRNSAVRRLAGIGTSATEFGQSALVTTVIHSEPHEGIALQRFQPVGAVASLPLQTSEAGHRSQIVWSDRTDAVNAAVALDLEALVALIDERLWGALEITALDGPVAHYPLSAQRSETLARDRVALIGDAARTIHPLAGQGFNLAIRDVAALVDGVKDAVATGQDIGTAGLLGYARWRRADETLLAGLTTALASAPPHGPLSLIGHARRAAFAAVDELQFLHTLLRREAAGESGDRPSLLR